jgi:flavodoxin
MTKTLIVFFSRKGNNYVLGNIVNLPIGNTKVAASKIQSLLNCDIFEIETVNEYPLDYTECTTQAKVELKENSRPKIKGQLPDVSGYDTIILGYPNWWGTFPMAVWTFL